MGGAGTEVWGGERRPLATLARNVTTRYLTIGVEILIGLLLLPFNLAYLGQAAYGLWVLTASITAYFSILDLGYGGALVKFVAQYRAMRDHEALNQTVSTLFVLFATVGALAYGLTALVAFNLEAIFQLSAEQAQLGRYVLLIIGLHVALSFAFSVYGGVINGFQRYDANSVVAIVSSVVVALMNVAVLLAGYGLVQLVLATTTVRILTLFVYRLNAYRIFPGLRLRPWLARTARLREVTGFSIYAFLIDWANKMNYIVDPIVIGAFLGSAPVAIWAVASRLVAATHRLTNQLNSVLFPLVVDSDAGQRADRLRQIFLQGTRLSLATVMPIAAALAVLAEPLVFAWVGSEFTGSVLVLQILAVMVAIRVGSATARTVLKGAGQHRMLAITNLTTGAIHVLLSVLLIRRFGLAGVAVATLVPVATASTLVLFPAACRRVGVPIGHAFRHGVWPGLWPVIVPTALFWILRPHAPATLTAVALQTAIGGIGYLAIFFGLAIGSADRRLYLDKVRQLVRRPAHLEAAA